MAITGVAIGSAGLLIAFSIVHGFKSTINSKIMGFAPHYTVVTYINPHIERADTLKTYVESFPEIQKAAYAVEGQIMIQAKDAVYGTIIKGIDETGGVTQITDYINKGHFDISVQESDKPGIIIGAKLAKKLNVDIGNIITIYTIDGVSSLIASPEVQQFELTGIYHTGIDQFDDVYALADYKYVRKLLNLSDKQAVGLELQLSDINQIHSYLPELGRKIEFPYFVESIFSKFGNIFAWVELQENMIPLVISVMVIVAAFNLIGTILMMVLERTRDIGILKTMGTKSSIIQRIFLLEGLLVAIIGLVIGIIITLLFVFLQSKFHIIPLSEENYYMSYAPVEPHLIDFIIVGIVTIILCAFASWIPSRVAAKTDPLKVIAYGR